MEEILLKLRRLTQQVKDSSAQTITDLKPTIDGIKTNFDEWKAPWTADRAGKIDTMVDAITELDADVGETADTGGTQNAGTVNAKLNAVLQRQKVIRGLAKFSGVTGSTLVRTIKLPQTINPDYANVSVGYITDRGSDRPQAVVVTNVTSTTIGIRLSETMTTSTASFDAYVEWQVVGGVE